MAFVLGALAALALPPLSVLPVLWISFPGLFLLLRGTGRARSAFAVGWFFSFGFLSLSLYWIAGSLFVDLKSFWWALPLALFALPAAFGLYYGTACALVWRWGMRRGGALAMLALLWFAADMARGVLFTGFPWNAMGYVWGDVLPVLQITSVIGIYGLSLLTMLFVLAPVPWLLGQRRGWVWPVMALLALAGLGLWGAARLEANPTQSHPDLLVRVVQPGIAQSEKWRADEREAHVETLLDLSFPPDGPRAKLVVWPETATSYLLEEDSARRADLAIRMTPEQILLTGALRREITKNGLAYFNSLIALDQKARVVAGYDKSHLVPFGEYMPGRGLLPVRALAGMGLDFSAGPGPRSLRVAGAPPFSPLVCYEAIFSGAVVDPEDPPQFLVNVTNDAWYEGTVGPFQHKMIARVRAIEEGVPLVRSANKGISLITDSLGRVVAEAGLDKPGFAEALLPLALEKETIFRRVGRLLLAIGTGFVSLSCCFQRQRRPKP